VSYLQAIVLGLVQGLGEFLPISSSAHLVLVPYIFGWTAHTDIFDVALHLGTLLAVVIFFAKDIWRLLKAGLTQGIKTVDGKLFWLIMVATVPAGLIGYQFEGFVDDKLRTAYLAIALAMAIMGVVLWLVDKYASKKLDENKLTWGQSILIGVSQALALLPGVSRSGATMTTGLLFGLTRESAARFSFLMSVPIIAGAGLLKLTKLHASDVDGQFIVGVVVAAVVGYLSIRWLLNYLNKGRFDIFAWYRFGFAALVIILLVVRR
jgi:undecaprenyl-diphosphatase